ncbi:MAG: hypothetical protein JEY97_01135 [Bacteroidales bacterium]|nr:hypothetical protein [Bacteroidales bacterium]
MLKDKLFIIHSFISRQNNILLLSILSVVLLILTFPEIDPEIGSGIDNSYIIAFNHFFSSDIQIVKDLIFTYGPLGFLKYPLPMGNNLEIGVIFISVLRLLFIFSVLYLSIILRKRNVLFSIILTFFASTLFNFDTVFFALIISTILIYKETNKKIFFLLSLFFLILGLYIKITIGIIGFLIFASFIIIDFIVSRKITNIIFSIVGGTLFFIIIWLIIYHDFSGIFQFFYNLIVLGLGNSSAFSINPENNWWYLSLMFLIFAIIPFISKQKNVNFLYGILFLALFASFKFAFAREDIFHLNFFLNVLYMFIFLFLIYIRMIKAITYVLLSLLIIFFYGNLNSIEIDGATKKPFFSGTKNFSSTFFNFNKLKENSVNAIDNNLKTKQLSPEILKTIGQETLDFFPWEISYIIPNKLNYSPRPMLQNGCLFAPPPIDNINAEFISSDKSAEFFIWELNQNKSLEGIDTRYIFNSDGNFLFEFLNNYKIIEDEENFLLLQKTTIPRFNSPSSLGNENYRFNEWINIPEIENGILKAKFEIHQTFAGIIKSLLYKEEEYYVEYELDNATIIKHRFSRDNSLTGLWINPYLIRVSNELIGEKVKRIRLSFSDKEFLIKDEINILWEQITFNDTLKSSKQNIHPSELIISKNYNFENINNELENWKSKIDSKNVFSGKHSLKMSGEDIYSPGFISEFHEVSVTQFCIISISADVFLLEKSNPLLVFSVSRNGETIFWETNSLQTNDYITNQWNKLKLDVIIRANIFAGDKISAYLWNKDKKPLILDNLRMDVFALE